MEIVEDIHGNKFQMVRGKEPTFPGSITVQFKANNSLNSLLSGWKYRQIFGTGIS